MSINPEIRDQAYRFFVEEAPELLQAIEAGLLTLRQERNPATIHAVMRSAHSIKGGAASVELDAIKTIAHRLETIFKALYSDQLEITAHLESQLLQAYDCLRIPLMQQIEQGYFEVEQAIATAEPILSQLEEQCQAAILQTENFIPGSADLGVNMAASIFETDVAEGLAHLEQVLEHPQNYAVAGELRAQAEVFLGFAELLSLEGFAAIAQIVIEAIDRVPGQAVLLTQVALKDFRAGRDAVLSGDLAGGSPSAALLTFIETAAEDELSTLSVHDSGNAAVNAIDDNEIDRITDAASDSDVNIGVAAQLSEAEIEAIVQQELQQELLQDEMHPEFLQSINEFSDNEFLDQSLDQFAEVNDSQLTDSQSSEEIAAATPIAENQFSLESIFADFAPAIDSQDNLFIENAASPDQLLLEQTIPSTDELPDNLSSNLLSNLASDEIFDESLLNEAFNAFEEPIEIEGDDRLTRLEISSEVQSEIHAPEAVTVKMPAPPQPEVHRAVSGLTVRVDADRLERLNNLLGEMTINRNGLALQTEQTRVALRELRNRFEQMQSTLDQIRTLSDQLLVAPDHPVGGTAAPRPLAAFAGLRSAQSATLLNATFLKGSALATHLTALKEFDSLEMDRYTVLYASTQTLLEEMAQIEEAVEDMVLFNRQSEQTLDQHRKMLSQMQDDLMWARMLPLGDVLNRFPRVLRDISNTYDKPVDLFLSGTDLLIDKAVLERLYDPLLHLLRNSFDHGIESAELRRDRGKPATGRIEIQASSRGRQVVIEVRDDGQGLDFDRIRHKTIELGWLTEAEAALATAADLCELIFAPGFSTAAQVNELSGRGIGLDVVREQMQVLRGSATVRSTPTQGTTFTLKLPLTLTITNLLICLVNSRPVAFRSDGIREILVPQPDRLTQTENGQVLQWQEQQVPIYRMSDLLTYRCLVPELPPSRVLTAVPAPSNWQAPVLMLKHDQQFFALQIDRLITEQEFVVKPFGSAIAPPDYTYGCTVLGDGMLVPVIDALTLLESLPAPSSPLHPSTPLPLYPSTTHHTPTILVVDDALTSRRTLALSLERAGYRVLQARDGQEALEQLHQSRTVELIVCDIEMPNMNGFEFLTHRRQDPNLAQIPTIMLTSRSNDKHRWLAMQLGATAYFTKPYLEQEFLQAIGGMVGVKGGWVDG